MNKRKIFIIDPKFQYKFTFFILTIVILSSIIFPILIFSIFDDYTQLLQRFAPEKIQLVNQQKSAFIQTMILWEVGFVFILFSSCIFLTHKIAGPMYKLKKFLSSVRDSNLDDKLFFRSGDYFKDVAEEINLTLGYLKDRVSLNEQELKDIQAYLDNLSMVVPEDKKEVIDEINKKLNKINFKL